MLSIHKICFILFFGFVCSVFSQNTDESSLHLYQKALFDFNFEAAKSITNTSSFSPTEKEYLLLLSELWYYDGQETQKANYTVLVTKETTVSNCIAHLIKGNDALLHNNKNESFQYFFSAYEIANALQISSLQKLSLFHILKFYNFEYAQTHTRYKKYLKEFQFLAKEPIEKCWSYLYTLYFDYQSYTEDTDVAIKNNFILLENELKYLPPKSNFTTLYHAIKAIQLEYDAKPYEALDKHQLVIENSKNKPYLKYLAFRSYIRISEIYYNTKQYEKGLNAINQSKQYINKSDTLKSNLYITRFASKHHQAMGNYKEAYHLLNETINKQYLLDYKDNNIQNAALEIELQTAQKEKQILIEQQKKKQNRNIALGLGGGLITVSIIGLLLYKNIKRKQRITAQEKELEIKQKEKLLKDQELKAIDAMLVGQEKERARVASDLHDSIGATLSAAKLQFNHINKHIESTHPLSELYHKTSQLLENAYKEVREMSHLKNSGVIAKKGLLPAVQQLVHYASNENLVIEVQHYGLDKQLDNEKEIALFRIIQELVTNIIKHSQASEASISMTQRDDTLSVIIEDNGIGFTTQLQTQKGGIGLTNIEKRIEHWEGTLEIDSTPGKGTNILIELPI